MANDGLTSEEAHKIKEAQLTEQLKVANDTIEAMKKRIETFDANEKDRLVNDIIGRSTFKEDDLKEKSVDVLRTISLSLDAAGVTSGSVGVKKAGVDERKFTAGMTVGRWDRHKGEWVGGI